MRRLAGIAGMFFCGCSWTERFLVSNESDASVEVHYEVEPVRGEGLFRSKPTACETARSGEILWNRAVAVRDLDERPDVVVVEIPPRSVLWFGELSNDRYVRHDQAFINGRVFNLKKMLLEHGGAMVEVTPESFDRFFRKEGHHILYRIR